MLLFSGAGLQRLYYRWGFESDERKNCKLANLVGFKEVDLNDVVDLLMSDHEVLSNESLTVEKESR